MPGKIAAAFIGDKIAGQNQGAKGAITGVAVETVAKKVIPAIAAVAVLGFAYKMAKDYFEGEETA
ncbi:MAG TPA: hypothetical protein VFI88_00685 [Sphingomicrobium sp.]|jgi:hypothetical protein|nr:hypothetical protein [Sphingomicrobium sp.]